ncbi:site-specific integrase [Enterococcus faecium]|nr:site-specific integrase [Enterococcus faecium]MDQ8251913.1 site-specific integrase [Enterococcus faecium]MDQ8303994.1 site-specific integrase [Enterococcus faecium]MDQ8428101.1 site-specific integrase [Enterococcus faecium]MDQ8570298.1 site-specific integrase [Enterococcus faecium]
MATFEQYKKKNGKKLWKFQTYLGVDPLTGKQVRTTRRGFKTKKEAQLALTKLQLEYENNGLNKSKELTFQEVYDLWIVNYEQTVKESSFVKTKEQFANHILPAFGALKINKISIDIAQKFANEKVKKFVLYREFINNASRICDYAIKLGYLQDNPFKKITVPKRKVSVHEEDTLNFFNKEELEIFLKSVEKKKDIRMYSFFRTLAFTGMRVGELLALTWKDIDFNDNYIKINKTLARGKNRRLYVEQPKTKNSKRDIPVDDETMNILKKWRLEQRKWLLTLGINTLSKNQLVFSNQKNEYLQLSKPRKWLEVIIKQNNLKRITIHGLRHTHASLLLEAGANIKDVQERLGHSSIQITMDLYIHITDKRKEKTAAQFAKYIGI